MFELVDKLELVATSTDDSVLAALEHARAHWALRRDFIPLPPPVDGVDRFVDEDADDTGTADGVRWDTGGIAFASGNWQRAVTGRRRPGMVARKHFEAMVFTYLAEELRTGDVAVVGPGRMPTGAPTC